jgi:hypothetical protein
MQLGKRRIGTIGRFGTYLGRCCFFLFILITTCWAILAIWYTMPPSAFRTMVVVFYFFGSFLPPLLFRPQWRGLAITGGLFASVVIWFLSLTPSNHRDWQPDLAVLPWADMEGDKVVLHNIRYCDYRSEKDFTCHYYDRAFTLAQLHSVDLFLVYWGSPHIAHTMLSFGFRGGGNVCFSIETRKEIGEEYSAVRGFFRQYEKMYVMADERDVVRLRTNFRHEDVYLYSLKVKPEIARKVFLDYLGGMNQLKEQPEWYNALTGNCTTSIRQHTAPYNPDARLDWRLIVNGYLDRMIYDRGFLSQELPFETLKELSYINKKAQDAGVAADFSERIRAGLPDLSN